MWNILFLWATTTNSKRQAIDYNRLPFCKRWLPNNYKIFKSNEQLNAKLLFNLVFDTLIDTVKHLAFTEFFPDIEIKDSTICLEQDSAEFNNFKIVETNGLIKKKDNKILLIWPKEAKEIILRNKNNEEREILTKKTANCFKDNGKINRKIVPRVFRKEWKNEFK